MTPQRGDLLHVYHNGTSVHIERFLGWGKGGAFSCIGSNTSNKTGSTANGGGTYINDRRDWWANRNSNRGWSIKGVSRPYYGLTREDVRTVQRAAGIAVDGQMGPATKAAAQRLQTKHGLRADGFPGPATIAALGGTNTSAAPAAEEDDMYNDQDRARDARIAQIAELTDERINGIVAAQIGKIAQETARTHQIAELSDINLNGAGRIAALQGEVAGLGEAVKQIGQGQGIDLDAIKAAAEQGAKAGAASVSAADVAAHLEVTPKAQ